MAKQDDKKPKPLTPAEQLRANKIYREIGGKLLPGQNAKLVEGDEDNFRNRQTYAFNEPDPVKPVKPKEQPKKVVAATPVAKKEQPKAEVKKEQPKAEVKKEQPVEKKAIVKAVVEQKPAAKVKAQDTRGYNKEGKQNVVAKTAQKLTGVQSLRRAAELAANKLLTKSGSSLRFKKAIKEPVKKK
jgi:FtsZ-interacting cell division protein ZipA